MTRSASSQSSRRTISKLPLLTLRLLKDKQASKLLKNVYYQFLTANINLFLNAYIDSVSVSITVIDVLKTYIVPFVKYQFKVWSLTSNCCCFFKGKWYTAKRKSRDEARKVFSKT